jgi:hypothetical protein
MVRQHDRLAPIILLASLSLVATVSACSKQPTQASAANVTAAQAQAQATFRFAPPEGTNFVRYDQRREELSIQGSPLRSLAEEELRWNVQIHKSGENYLVDQTLAHASFKHDGQVLAAGDVQRKIAAQLLIDPQGNLRAVRGMDQTAATLEEMAAPDQKAAVHQLLTAKYLTDLVSTRYQMFFGDTIGHGAAPGASWTVQHAPGSMLESRKVTVERYEQCDDKQCARLRVDFNVNPQVLADTAVALVKAKLTAAGGDTSKIAVRRASYGLSGAMLVEPNTMLSHGTSLAEHGTVTIAGAKNEEIVVEKTGSLVVTYAYGAAPVALNE